MSFIKAFLLLATIFFACNNDNSLPFAAEAKNFPNKKINPTPTQQHIISALGMDSFVLKINQRIDSTKTLEEAFRREEKWIAQRIRDEKRRIEDSIAHQKAIEYFLLSKGSIKQTKSFKKFATGKGVFNGLDFASDENGYNLVAQDGMDSVQGVFCPFSNQYYEQDYAFYENKGIIFLYLRDDVDNHTCMGDKIYAIDGLGKMLDNIDILNCEGYNWACDHTIERAAENGQIFLKKEDYQYNEQTSVYTETISSVVIAFDYTINKFKETILKKRVKETTDND